MRIRSKSQRRQGSQSVDVCRDAHLSPAVCIGGTRRLRLAGELVACVVTPTEQETRTVSPMTIDVLARSDGLLVYGCTHVAMERTGD